MLGYYDPEDSVDKMLMEVLKNWHDMTVEAPKNELESLNAWIDYLRDNGAEKTLECMLMRRVLLLNAQIQLLETNYHEQEL